ncbi:MAG: ShlB/FhaC/HecB family hemolysin secretion/activation protein [Schwartzia sp. (in: firmicutes)]
MMRDRMRQMVAGLLLGGVGLSCPALGWAAPSLIPSGADSGVELRRQQEEQTRARLAEEMAAGAPGGGGAIEGTPQAPASETVPPLRFTLRTVTVDASAVLPAGVGEEAASPYLGREVTVADLYAIVEEINARYQKGGYLTCRAYLPPQTIHEGAVHIALFEGRVGAVRVRGNGHTRDVYLTSRMEIAPGDIPRYQDMDEAIRWFNATNDVQLRLALQAGEAPGTTDFTLTAEEPKNEIFTLYGDNAGGETTGRWRKGVYYTNRSVFDWRDRLTLGFLHTQGVKSFNAGYSIPVGRRGGRLSFDYSANATEVVNGQYRNWGIPVIGHADAIQASFTQPLWVTPALKAEASLTLSRQHSVTDMTEARLPMIDDTFTQETAALAFTHYGKGRAFYHRHAFTRGHWENASLTRLAKPSADYTFYALNAVYQQGAAHGQIFTARTNVQISANEDIRPSRQFYLGGVYSVRGYEENALGAANGFSATLEYAVPVMKKPDLRLYGFFDYGTLWGENVPDHHVLSSVGLGLRANFSDWGAMDVSVGMPLCRTIGYDAAPTAVDKMRVHLLMTAQF